MSDLDDAWKALEQKRAVHEHLRSVWPRRLRNHEIARALGLAVRLVRRSLERLRAEKLVESTSKRWAWRGDR